MGLREQIYSDGRERSGMLSRGVGTRFSAAGLIGSAHRPRGTTSIMSPEPPDPAAAPNADVLAPLRVRYAHWLGLDAAQVERDREEAVEDVRALQLVLRMERAQPPS